MIQKYRLFLQKIFSVIVLTALICLGAQIRIPMGEVPIVMTSLVIYSGSLILGSRLSFSATIIYLLMGSLGLPVFSGGSAGYQHLYGPTGGYMIGFALSAYSIGKFSEKKKEWRSDIQALLVGSVCIHGLGILWMSSQFPESWQKMFVRYPVFLLADAMKMLVALFLALLIRSLLVPKQNRE